MLDSSQATACDVVKKGVAGRDNAEEIERALGAIGEVRTDLTNYQHAMSGALNEQITRFGRQKEEMDGGISGGTSADYSLRRQIAHIYIPPDSICESWQEQTSPISAY